MSLAPFFFSLLCPRSSEICQLHRLANHHLEFDGHFCMLSKVFPCFDIECSVLQFRCFETDSDALGLHTMCNSGFVQLILTFYFFWVASVVMALIQDAPPGWLLISCINWFGLGVDTIICNPHKHIWKLVLDTNWYSSVAHNVCSFSSSDSLMVTFWHNLRDSALCASLVCPACLILWT